MFSEWIFSGDFFLNIVRSLEVFKVLHLGLSKMNLEWVIFLKIFACAITDISTACELLLLNFLIVSVFFIVYLLAMDAS